MNYFVQLRPVLKKDYILNSDFCVTQQIDLIRFVKVLYLITQ